MLAQDCTIKIPHTYRLRSPHPHRLHRGFPSHPYQFPYQIALGEIVQLIENGGRPPEIVFHQQVRSIFYGRLRSQFAQS
jgi:hypothetical protein